MPPPEPQCALPRQPHPHLQPQKFLSWHNICQQLQTGGQKWPTMMPPAAKRHGCRCAMDGRAAAEHDAAAAADVCTLEAALSAGNRSITGIWWHTMQLQVTRAARKRGSSLAGDAHAMVQEGRPSQSSPGCSSPQAAAEVLCLPTTASTRASTRPLKPQVLCLTVMAMHAHHLGGAPPLPAASSAGACPWAACHWRTPPAWAGNRLSQGCSR